MYGIRGVVNIWPDHYLNRRLQFVYYGSSDLTNPILISWENNKDL